MTDDIDTALRGLASAPLPAALARLDGAVMARIEHELVERAARPAFGPGLGAAAVALLIGVAASTTPSAAAPGDATPLQLSVFTSHAALAPSTLLASR